MASAPRVRAWLADAGFAIDEEAEGPWHEEGYAYTTCWPAWRPHPGEPSGSARVVGGSTRLTAAAGGNTPEIHPTQLRATGMGTASGMTQIAGAFLVGGLGVLAARTETRGRALADTIEEGDDHAAR